MKSLHIRDLSPQTLDALKRLARLHHRSLQGELHAILERAAQLAPPADEGDELRLHTVDTGRRHDWNREELYGDEAR